MVGTITNGTTMAAIEGASLAPLLLRRINGTGARERLAFYRENPGAIMGIPTGFSRLDRRLGGLRKGTLNILAARPKVGKTGWVLNVVMNAAAAGYKVGFFSQEMPLNSLVWRMASIYSGIPGMAVQDGYRIEYGQEVALTDDEWWQFEEGIAYAEGLPVAVSVGGVDTSDMWRTLETMWTMGKPLDLIVVDHIGLHTDMPTATTYQRATHVIKQLKEMKLAFDVPILAVAQLNRSVESRDDKRPLMSDLRDSGAVEENADTVLLMYRADYYTPEDDEYALKPSDVELNVAANREGPTGVVYFSYNRGTQVFLEKGKKGEVDARTVPDFTAAGTLNKPPSMVDVEGEIHALVGGEHILSHVEDNDNGDSF